MVATRRYSLVTLALVAAPWSVLLGVSGLWLVFSGPSAWPGQGRICVVGGITLFMAGQLVCSFLIADRIFPRGGRAVGWFVEIPSCILLFAGCLWLCWATLRALALGP
jgi:hypothetical protein